MFEELFTHIDEKIGLLLRTKRFFLLTQILGITGTLIIQETETIPGYVLDKYSQTVKVNADDIQPVTFYNTPLGGVELIKVDAADKSKRLGV